MRTQGNNRHPLAVAYLALTLALTGSAYAAATISSGDVVNESLLSKDLKDDAAVKSSDVRDDSKPGGGLKGKDIIEGSLGQVPTASNALMLEGQPASSYIPTQINEAWTTEGGSPSDRDFTFGSLALKARCVHQGTDDPEFQLLADGPDTSSPAPTVDVGYIQNGGSTADSGGTNVGFGPEVAFTETETDARGVGTLVYRFGTGQITVIQFRIYVTTLGSFAVCEFAGQATTTGL